MKGFAVEFLMVKSTFRTLLFGFAFWGAILTAPARSEVKIMPLGDSITRGWYGSNYRWGYRKPLYDRLINNGNSFRFVGTQSDGSFSEPNHEGHDGWHADAPGTNNDILGRIYSWLTANPADIVLLHIGTNDITYGGQNVNEVNAILDEIDRYSTNIKVVLALIIDRYPHSAATTQFNIDVNNMAQNRIAAGDDIIVVDMEHALNYPSDLADNLHPNDSGYTKMADVWFDALSRILTPPSITSTPITKANLFQTYYYDVNADGYPEPTYSLITYPQGMTIDSNTGLIEWLPESVGDFNVVVKASNGQMPDANQSFVISVSNGIKFDAASCYGNSSEGNSLSWQHPIAGKDQRVLVVGIAGEDNDINNLVISDIKYNDVNMFPIENSSITISNGGLPPYMKTELYYLLDDNLPASAGSYTVEIKYNGNVARRCGSAVSLTGVLQCPAEAITTNAVSGQNTISTNIATLTDNSWIVDIIAAGDGGGTFYPLDSNMIKRFDVNNGNIAAAGCTRPVESAQEITMIWMYSETASIAYSAAAFAPALHLICGFIREPNESPVEGVLVATDANGSYGITDSNGYYEIWVPYGWSGTVTPTKESRLFRPAERTYNHVMIDILNQNYKDVTSYDLDSDGYIDWGDVRIITDNWLISGLNIAGDIHKDDDNIVNLLDFSDLVSAW